MHRRGHSAGAALAALLLAACSPAPPDASPALPPQLGLMTSLPLYWPADAALADIAGGTAAPPWQRRAIEARFEELLAQGFDTFALVDLDRFKAINDLHGHQVGDAALIACASAIRPGNDRDSIAVRLGGEEFVVLLRGERTLERRAAELLEGLLREKQSRDLALRDLHHGKIAHRRGVMKAVLHGVIV